MLWILFTLFIGLCCLFCSCWSSVDVVYFVHVAVAGAAALVFFTMRRFGTIWILLDIVEFRLLLKQCCSFPYVVETSSISLIDAWCVASVSSVRLFFCLGVPCYFALVARKRPSFPSEMRNSYVNSELFLKVKHLL